MPIITQGSGAPWVWKQRKWGEKKGGLPLSLPLCGCFQTNRIPSTNCKPRGTGTGMDGRTPSGGFDTKSRGDIY